MQLEVTTAAVMMVGSGLTSAAVTVAAIRTDVKWLKEGYKQLEGLINKAEERLNALERKVQP